MKVFQPQPRRTFCIFVVGMMLAVNAWSQSSLESDFQSWARDAAAPIESLDLAAPSEDLAWLRDTIDDARIVALAEFLHGAAEPLLLRNRVFRYLVEEEGFSAIAIESGTVESEILYDYVLGSEENLDRVLAEGFSWQFETLPQNAELLRWMRTYNLQRPETQRIRIYGFDVPGSPGNVGASRGPQVALEGVLDYLAVVDPDSASDLEDRVRGYLPRLQTDYAQLPQSDRDSLTVAEADAVAFLEANQVEYVRRSSDKAYWWAHRAAIGARQVDAWLRRIPVGWTEGDGFKPFEEANNIRDRAMADHVSWILDDLGNDARLFVFASFAHITRVSLTDAGPSVARVPFGAHMDQRYGDHYRTFGTSMGGGAIGNCIGNREIGLTDASPTSINGLMSPLGVPLFMLDLRSSPGAVNEWLRENLEVWNGFRATRFRIADAVDAVIFAETFSPACE
jgi:erythromycin esterase